MDFGFLLAAAIGAFVLIAIGIVVAVCWWLIERFNVLGVLAALIIVGGLMGARIHYENLQEAETEYYVTQEAIEIIIR